MAKVTDSFDQLLIGAFNNPGIGMVDLKSHILYLVLLPDEHLILTHEEQRQCEVVQDCLNVGLAHLAHFICLERH